MLHLVMPKARKKELTKFCLLQNSQKWALETGFSFIGILPDQRRTGMSFSVYRRIAGQIALTIYGILVGARDFESTNAGIGVEN